MWWPVNAVEYDYLQKYENPRQIEGKPPVILMSTHWKCFVREEILPDLFKRPKYVGGEKGNAYWIQINICIKRFKNYVLLEFKPQDNITVIKLNYSSSRKCKLSLVLLNTSTYIWNKGNVLKDIVEYIFLKHLFGHSSPNLNDIHISKALAREYPLKLRVTFSWPGGKETKDLRSTTHASKKFCHE